MMPLTRDPFDLDAATDAFLLQKATRTGSLKTVKAYRETLASFRAFLAKEGLDLLDPPGEITRFAPVWASHNKPRRHQLPSRVTPASPNSYNQRLAILSSWYSFVQQTYHLDVSNPIKEVPHRRVQPYAAAVPIDPEEVEAALESINRDKLNGLRDYAILAVALATGRRSSELVGLRAKDLKITRGTKRPQEPRITLTFRCKGHTSMRDTLDAETSAVVLDYLHAQYGPSLLTLSPDAPLWVSYSRQNPGQAIGTETLSQICERTLHTTKVHATRHTFAVGLNHVGAPITAIAGRLGHTDIRTTQIYLRELLSAENPYAEQLSARFGIKRQSGPAQE